MTSPAANDDAAAEARPRAARTLDARLAGRALARGACGAGLALLGGDGVAGALILGGALGGTALVERLALGWARSDGRRGWRAAAAASAGSAALVAAALAHLVALHDVGSVGFDAGATSMAVALAAIARLGLLGVLTVGGAVLVAAVPAGASLLMDLAEEGQGDPAWVWLVGGATLAGLLPTLVALGGLPVGVQAAPASLANVAISLVVGFPIAFVGAAALEVGLLLLLLVVDALGDVAARLVGPVGET